MTFILAVSACISMALAWHTPGTPLCALLGWFSSVLFCCFVRSGNGRYREIYLGGLALHLIGFSWMYSTISVFGGFNWIESSLIFLLFSVLSSLQFPIFYWLSRRLRGSYLERHYLSTALSWTLAEEFCVRIFPWSAGHTQLGFPQFAQIADLGGHALIAFVMFWLSDAVVCTLRRDQLRRKSILIPALALLLSVCYGSYKIDWVHGLQGPEVSVALIQGNVTVEEKHDVKMFKVNTHRYAELSLANRSENQLTIWPESVLQEWIPAKNSDITGNSELKFSRELQGPLLVGALTYDSETEFYNSALLVQADGTTPAPYHKQILMPFGEYTPFEQALPWLKSIHETPDFTPGSSVRVMEVQRSNNGLPYTLAPLICYEDVVPRLSRDATRNGAQLLVNLTNDAWFGDSIAPQQHNLIASFRAIENRRYLLRSTNSGLTSIIDPCGRTVSSLPTFQEGVLKKSVLSLSTLSIYTRYFHENIYLITLVIWLIFAMFSLSKSPLKK